jgi:hypothetical protein
LITDSSQNALTSVLRRADKPQVKITVNRFVTSRGKGAGGRGKDPIHKFSCDETLNCQGISESLSHTSCSLPL